MGGGFSTCARLVFEDALDRVNDRIQAAKGLSLLV